MLRRKKDSLLNGKPILELPDRVVDIVPCNFDDEEREFYNSIEARVDGTINKIRQMGDVQKNYTSMLVLLLRLRQGSWRLQAFCVSQWLILLQLATILPCYQKISLQIRKLSNPKPQRVAKTLKTQTIWQSSSDKWVFRLLVNVKCVRPRMLLVMPFRYSHLKFLSLSSSNSASESKYCNDCDLIARRKSISPSSSLPPDSAKIRKILEILDDVDERSDGVEKTIIFSQFTSMLDVIQPFLKDRGFKFVRCEL